MDLAADNLVHDKEKQILTAKGHVVLQQAGRILKADEVQYNMASDTVLARGNVVLNEPSGDIHFADEVALTGEMKTGLVFGLQSYLSEGGQFTAQEGEQSDGGQRIVMYDAAYTPCECDTDKKGNPAWQIRAREVIYDKENHRIIYKHARFEIFGVPLLYSPYLAHPDGREKRKSGFLTPGLAFDSQLGTVVTNNYYWDIAPNRDATVGVMVMTQEAPVALGEYRHRFEQAALTLSGSTTYSARTDSVGGEDVKKREEWRGHVFADGRWDIDNKWRAGTELELTSDDQYLRQYDFSHKDVLENQVYVERFSGRHYGVGRVMAFQDVRVREEQTDQPNVLPEFEMSFVGEPNATLGGRWQADVSALGLQRNGNGQDMTRVVAQAGWQKRHVSRMGFVNTLTGVVRGDAYYAQDRDIATPGSGRSRDAEQTRGFAQAHLVTSYPLVRSFERMQAVIEPVAALTLAPNIDAQNDDIPNEDSKDVQLDTANLFNPSRFPGMDKIEDQSRLTYGLRPGLYGHKGSYIEAFGGQSYRFDDSNNPFTEGSGLTRQGSDLVGQLTGVYNKRYGINYRFQVDSAQLTSQRHEFDGYAKWDRLSVYSRYLFAKALEGTDISESREQIQGSSTFKLTERWQLRNGALYDLGEDQGLRKAMLAIDYIGCCMSMSLAAERSLTTDSSGDSGTDIMFRLGLKNLGEFQTSGSGGWGAGNVPE
ncbi:MAG: LPS-assembly protein LptD [Rhodospirillales bacterium]|nr:LPS-assembly protein LptD [Rhodospirillales bacterium]